MLNTDEINCPPGLLARTRARPALRTVVAGAHNAVVLESVQQAVDEDLIEPVLVGPADEIRRLGDENGLDLSAFEIVDAVGEGPVAEATARVAASSDTGGVMKGSIHTDDLMGALLSPDARVRTDRRMTHVFHMTVAGHDRALMITDAALNILPDIKTKKAALENVAGLSHRLGIERPKIAILSATEEPNDRIPSSIEARDLTLWAENALPAADIHGPLAFDNAVSPKAAKMKGIKSHVAGDADILLVPNIECGNALFKMMVYFMGACAGGIVLGGRIPIMLTSRADPPAARLASAALANLAVYGGD